MKKFLIISATILLSISTWAQSPEKMSYQAVVRDANNELVVNQLVGMQISILKGSIAGNPVYEEVQFPATNANGLVSFEIGTGNWISGDFSDIDWANDTYFIKTETDPEGGSSYSIEGVNQLLSVPYALHAKTADRIAINPLIGYVHENSIDNFDLKIYNGQHLFYDVSAAHEIYNSESQQFGYVGVSKDNHDPIDPNNDARTMMVHNDAPREKTKLVVLEPGELTIAVLDASASGTSPLATVTMKDDSKEILIGNSYDGMSNMQNNIRLGTESTTMELIDVSTGAFQVFEFGENGLSLYNNGVKVWGINPDGSTYTP